MNGFSTPTWKQVGDMQSEIDMLHQENCLKLKQILDLEEILYNTRILDLEDNSPCWCCMPDALGDKMASHTEDCEKARQATKHLWSF